MRRVDAMLRMRLTGPGCLIDWRQTDLAHQTPDSLAADAPALAAQMPRHLARAIPGHFHKSLIDDAHQFEVLRALTDRLAIERGPRDRNLG